MVTCALQSLAVWYYQAAYAFRYILSGGIKAEWLFSFFLSGHMFPLTMLPDNVATVVNFLPFKYLAYFPAAIFLGKIPQEDLPMELAVEACWLTFFIIVCRIAYARGVRRYSGFGG